MKTVTRAETELRLRINALFLSVMNAARNWTPPPALIRMIREAAACRLADPGEGYWLSLNATDLMNEQLGMDAIPGQVSDMIRAANLLPEQEARTRLWTLAIRHKHQRVLNKIPIDWMWAQQP